MDTPTWEDAATVWHEHEMAMREQQEKALRNKAVHLSHERMALRNVIARAERTQGTEHRSVLALLAALLRGDAGALLEHDEALHARVAALGLTS